MHFWKKTERQKSTGQCGYTQEIHRSKKEIPPRLFSVHIYISSIFYPKMAFCYLPNLTKAYFNPIRNLILSIPLLDQLKDMLIEEPPTQVLLVQILRTTDPPHTPLLLTKTLERSFKLPLSTRIKEGQIISLLQLPILHNPDFHLLDIDF